MERDQMTLEELYNELVGLIPGKDPVEIAGAFLTTPIMEDNNSFYIVSFLRNQGALNIGNNFQSFYDIIRNWSWHELEHNYLLDPEDTRSIKEIWEEKLQSILRKIFTSMNKYLSGE